MTDRLLRSMAEQDRAAIVICDLSHRVVYMNPAAVRNYAKWGGEAILGRSLLDCHNEESRKRIREVTEWFAESPSNNMIYTSHNDRQNKDVYMVALRDEAGKLIGYYEKHEYRDRERAAFYDFTRSLI